jgi:hypothetical protein
MLGLALLVLTVTALLVHRLVERPLAPRLAAALASTSLRGGQPAGTTRRSPMQ